MHLFRRRNPTPPAVPKPTPRDWIGGVKVNHPDLLHHATARVAVPRALNAPGRSSR